MSECSQPGRPALTGIWFVVDSQCTPDGVLIQVEAESEIDLLCDSRAALSGITLLHFNDGFDDFL